MINKREEVGLQNHNDSKAFIEYSKNIDYIIKENIKEKIKENVEEKNFNKENKILILFDDMIANMLSNKKPVPIVTGLVNDANLASV